MSVPFWSRAGVWDALAGFFLIASALLDGWPRFDPYRSTQCLVLAVFCLVRAWRNEWRARR